MPEGSPLRLALKQLIQEVLDENSTQTTGDLQPTQGTVININDDGTVDVQASDQTFYGVGYPDPNVVIGTIVIVVTGDGVTAAIPQ